MTPFITTHEPPSKVCKALEEAREGRDLRRGLGFSLGFGF